MTAIPGWVQMGNGSFGHRRESELGPHTDRYVDGPARMTTPVTANPTEDEFLAYLQKQAEWVGIHGLETQPGKVDWARWLVVTLRERTAELEALKAAK